MGIRTGNSQIHEYWDNEQVVAGEFMQLFDWAKPDAPELRRLLDQLSLAAFVDDSSSSCLVSNNAFAKLFGLDASKSSRSFWPQCIDNERTDEVDELRDDLWHDAIPYSASAEVKVSDGSTRWLWTRVIPIKNVEGEVVRSLGIVIDIHERVQARLKLERSEQRLQLQNSELRTVHRELAHQAAHDGLTGLPNRVSLTELLNSAIIESSVGILFLDLDGFKQINDTLGHAAGDELLVEVAKRLKCAVRPTDTVARIGGDEFVIMCPQMRNRSEATALAERVRRVMETAFHVSGTMVSISASIGIAFNSEDDEDAKAVLIRADAAMYNAKNLGRARSQIFEDSMLDLFGPKPTMALAN